VPMDQYTLDTMDRITDTKLRATMLPFGDQPLQTRALMATHGVGLLIEDDPAVQTWEIQNDGTVVVRSACILKSYPSREPLSRDEDKMSASIQAVPAGNYVNISSDIDEWLSSFHPESEKYAVCLLRRSKSYCDGIFIERVYCSEHPKTFIKIGTFRFLSESGQIYNRDSFEPPPPEPVDWVIL